MVLHDQINVTVLACNSLVWEAPGHVAVFSTGFCFVTFRNAHTTRAVDNAYTDLGVSDYNISFKAYGSCIS